MFSYQFSESDSYFLLAQTLHENLPNTKIVESEEHLNTLFLNLLLQVVTIAREESKAMVIGFKILDLLTQHGLIDEGTGTKIEDVELKQFYF